VALKLTCKEDSLGSFWAGGHFILDNPKKYHRALMMILKSIPQHSEHPLPQYLTVQVNNGIVSLVKQTWDAWDLL
jgi:hypothetical protein